MKKSSFRDFYTRLGLEEYPFSTYTTENEQDKVSDLFIQPADYAPIIESFNRGQTMILVGNRGTGKTALLLDLLRKKSADDTIVCFIDDFSDVRESPEIIDYYNLILRRLTGEIFARLVNERKRINLLKREERILLSFLLYRFTTAVTKREIKAKIEQIQINRFLSVGVKLYNFVRFLLNYGATAASNFISDTITSHFAKLPPLVDGDKIKEFFPEIMLHADESFISADASYSMLVRVISLTEKLGFKNIIIAFDKLDEDPRFENDADLIAEFVKPITTDNKLLLNLDTQLVISLWAVPFNNLKDIIRTQKHYCPVIEWTENDLVYALNRRLKVFSRGKVDNYESLFQSLTPELRQQIFLLSNANPRDLWHVFHNIFDAQYELDSEATGISNEAIYQGLKNFVTRFNFYEYYPRRKNARANTMDVYSYIAHLLKLKTPRFTKNQLNDAAGTGSSTSNYVVSMERMGLVVKDGQRSGSVIYRISDPKILYAMENNLSISKS